MFSKSASKELKEESSAVKQMTQKEYLKKYLSNDSSKKKKKKKIKIAPSTIQRSQIIDDDIDLKKMRLLGENELDLNQLDEDAPQIAGIIDERPPELQTIESYRNSGRWKAISDETTGEIGISDKHAEAEERKKLTSINNKALARRFITHNIEKPSSRSLDTHSRNSSKKQKKVSDSDLSPSRPPRKSKAGNDSDVSPLRPSRKLDSGNDSDLSPARPSKKLKSGYESDQSPPRQSRKHKSGYDSDISPPRPSRKQKSGNDSDLSPVRPSRKHKSGNDSDLSPPRLSRKHKSGNDSDLSPLRPSRKYKSGNDSDLSPPRPSRKHKSGNDSDLSPPRPSRKHRSGNDSDLSPPRPSRKHKSGNDSDLSPPRPSRNHKSGNDSDLSPPRPSRKYKSESNADFSPPRPSRKYENNRENYRGRREENSNFRDSKTFSKRDRDFHDSRSLNSRSSRENNRERKSRFDDRSPDNSSRSDEKKMTETLSGKKAGLQDARALKQENMKIKEKEDIAFKQMSASVSGEGAGAVVRDRRTGRIRDPEREKEFKKRKEAKQAIDNEKYEKWGKGLKQVEDYKEKLENDLYEMAKPLARYADDDDLDEFLKSQDREGDPMLEYLREKKVKTSGPFKEKPTYKGPYPPNRFNIRPGYRWDGVDRSSGYEKQWFSKQNERKAVSEEAYKWSTADM